MNRAGARGAVLAGGAARRYGGVPKGLLAVGGRRILDRVVDAVQDVTGSPPLLIANAPDAASWRPDLQILPDVRPGFGTLGGIYTAVSAGATPVLCVAWDMPFVPHPLLRALLDRMATGDYDAVLPESSGRRGLEPLCAVYGAACAPAIARRLESGDLKAIAFHADVRVGIVPLAQVRAFGDPDESFFNVNTPDDLVRAEALCQRRG
ncbi:MAG TPA: molybdenum cofactor guanylyltransferase [Gemmatimonadales bacterium]|nr:molybdenum cofactor guanylyltransferase [Gemmatimonadales bacterium]